MTSPCENCGQTEPGVCRACVVEMLDRAVESVAQSLSLRVSRLTRRLDDLVRRVGDLEHDMLEVQAK